MKEILIVDMGLPQKKIRKEYGLFSDMFVTAIRAINPAVDFVIARVDDATWEDFENKNGVILTGAHEGVYDTLSWHGTFDPLVRNVIVKGLPILGVCFGHQYLAELLGGKVEFRPEKREFGLRHVDITEAGLKDPLFKGIENPAGFLFSHNDLVVEQAPGTTILAGNELVPVESFRWGKNVWGIQFHPEFTADIARTIISLLDEEDSTKEKLLKHIDAPHGGLTVLSNFIDICIHDN